VSHGCGKSLHICFHQKGELKMSLTPQEESVLKRLAQENMPLARPSTPPARQQGFSLENYLVAQFKKLKKMVMVNPNEDWGVIGRVKHTFKQGELLSQWYARTGLGRAQLLTMSKDQITRFVATAEENFERDGIREPRSPSHTRQEPGQPNAKPHPGVSLLI
jgi:hypothetical protein